MTGPLMALALVLGAGPVAECDEKPAALRVTLEDLVIRAGADGALELIGLPAETSTPAPAVRPTRRRVRIALDPAGERYILGRELHRCDEAGRCARVGLLPGAVGSAVGGPAGWLYAVEGSMAGLYRAPRQRPGQAVLLIAGRVEALCGTGEGDAWAQMQRGGEVRLVAASTETPAVRPFALGEVFDAALAAERVQASAWAALLQRAAAEAWPRREALALQHLEDESPRVRRAVARVLGGVRSLRSIAALWLLGHDPDAEVRLDALYASARLCEGTTTPRCVHLFASFLGAEEGEVSWTARDLLLRHDPQVALDEAPSAYKLDAISALVLLVQRDGDPLARRALKLLAADSDPQVRDAAGMALVGTLP